MTSELWAVEEDGRERASVTREVLIEAEQQEVWEAIASEEGRERWLEDAGERAVEVEVSEPPARVVWWWSPQEGVRTRVEFLIAPVVDGTRVLVRESAPRFPVEMLARCATMVLA